MTTNVTLFRTVVENLYLLEWFFIFDMTAELKNYKRSKSHTEQVFSSEVSWARVMVWVMGGHSDQPVPKKENRSEGKKELTQHFLEFKAQSRNGKSKHIHVRPTAPFCHQAGQMGHRVKQTSPQFSALSSLCWH